MVWCALIAPALPRRFGLAVLALTTVWLSACAIDNEQARICERSIPWFERNLRPVVIFDREAAPEHSIVIRYRDHAQREHRLVCRFGGGYLNTDRLQLIGVESDREGELAPLQVQLLKSLWLGYYEPGSARVRQNRQTLLREALYFCQQLLNAAVLSCLYGLLAAGYTLVYSLIGRLNLAFGELAMLGAYVTVSAMVFFAALPLWLVLLSVSGLALAFGAGGGWLNERLVFRPLRASATEAPLIASVGLILVLQESARLLQGSRDHWLQPLLNTPHVLAQADGFSVVVTTLQCLIVAAALLIFIFLNSVISASAYGRAQRACADDAAMAALCGVAVNRVVAQTFMLGSGCAALVGYAMALYYGVVNSTMGFVFGLKALTAAIVGGIGSLPGALLGGFLIGGLETLWSAYFAIAYKDVAVFILLVVFLALRPQGLFGR